MKMSSCKANLDDYMDGILDELSRFRNLQISGSPQISASFYRQRLLVSILLDLIAGGNKCPFFLIPPGIELLGSGHWHTSHAALSWALKYRSQTLSRRSSV
jgi:hypothetical protein